MSEPVAEVMAKVGATVGPCPWVRVVCLKFPGLLIQRTQAIQVYTEGEATWKRLTREIEQIRARVYTGYLVPVSEAQWWKIRAKTRTANLYLESIQNEVMAVLPGNQKDPREVNAARRALTDQLEDIYNRALILESMVAGPTMETPLVLPPAVHIATAPAGEGLGPIMIKERVQPSFTYAEATQIEPLSVTLLAQQYHLAHDAAAADLGEIVDPPSPAVPQ